MSTLLALDFALGPDLERAVRDAVARRETFCVLDQRLSARRRRQQAEALGATAVVERSGRTALASDSALDVEIGLVMPTSGSSGPPKAALLTWDALSASAEITQATLRGDDPPVWFPCLPANHIGGLAVLLRAVLSDATLLWGETDELAKAPASGATHVAVVGTQLARYDLRGFQKVLLGGGRPPRDRPENVVATWGMTETGSGVVYDGRALPGVEVVSVNGEICVRSPTLFRSYRSSPRPSIVGPDGADDWFPTGDAGDVTNGVVSVRGRLGFVINTGGEKLWPEDLEAVLAAIPGIVDVAITGVEDPEWGERVIAFVVSGGSNVDDTIAAVAAEEIGPWAKPKEVHYVTAIPRTGNGKVRRGDLANLF